jgi:pilus assembly protein CpaB
MFKKRGLVLLLLSITMGVGAAWVANNWVQQRGELAAEVPTGEAAVMTAAIDIPYGTKVEARHIRTMMLPEKSIPAGAIRTMENVEGYVSTAEILAGEILFKGRFVEHNSGSTLAALVEPNKRAVTVRVDDVIGVAGFLLPGNFVDVLATRVERSSKRAVSETVLRNIKVLAVDQTAKTDENEPVVVRAVTLEMTPAQAEVLVKRKEEGTIQLTLRNPLDTMVAEEKPEPAPAPKPVIRRAAPKPSTDTTVTVIRGTRVETKKAKS